MFREMRRENQALPHEECLRILNVHKEGVLALLGDGGYPYAVPMNYSMMDGKIYFHSAVEGHKIDALRACDKASFCVIDADDVDAAHHTTRFRSVIAFGRVRLVEDEELKRRALWDIGNKYCPAAPDKTRQEIDGAIARTAIIELSIEHLSGKENKDLARRRRENGQA